MTKMPFGFTVTRGVGGEAIFETTGFPLTFEDQFLSLTTKLPAAPFVYGLGERVQSLRLPYEPAATYTIWNKDIQTPFSQNVYGSHPFYLEMRNGLAHGVFLLNSNGMDVVLQSGSLQYRAIGGVFDFWFIMGPTPIEVIQQYSQIIGKPHLPPYWGLGWHQCRYGWRTLNETAACVANYSKNDLPLDTIWNDIDYMDHYKDFTVAPDRYPAGPFRAFVDDLHANGQQYIVITDPGIKIDSSYDAFSVGQRDNVFIQVASGNAPVVGQVWPGYTAFPDWTHPNTSSWWNRQISRFHELIPFDGLWIDMNEASSFCWGPQCPPYNATMNPPQALRKMPNAFDPNNPPYKLENGGEPLYARTFSLDAKQFLSGSYNLHNLFGHGESIATKDSLESLTGQRSVVITRSTFAGTGHHAGHWLGDNHSTWADLRYSISGVLTMQMFNIPFVGADICGFALNTTMELCTRWMQLGTLYPFSRNHNSKLSSDQEPYRWGPAITDINRASLNRRYLLLPYFYTLMFHSHMRGDTVWNPLFFLFSNDTTTLDLDRQFMIGRGLLVSPVLDEGATSVKAYFPRASWFDFASGAPAPSGWQIRPAPLDAIPIHVRGGHIIPTQAPALTSAAARLNPFGLIVALDSAGTAAGDLFVDDGVSLTSIRQSKYSFISFTASGGNVVRTVPQVLGDTSFLRPLASVQVYGIKAARVATVIVNGSTLTPNAFSFNPSTGVRSHNFAPNIA